MSADEYKHAGTVDHPAHYGGDTTYECIKVIEAWDLNPHFTLAVKHICRAGKKEGETAEKDIEKAIWYLRRRLTYLREKKNG